MTTNPLHMISKFSASLSKGEKKIADFIIANYNDIPNYSIKTFSKKAEVSESSIIRFSQKIGFTGYSELKIGCATLAVTESQKSLHFKHIVTEEQLINQEFTVQNILEVYQINTARTIESNLNALNPDTLETIVQLFLQKDAIYFVGEGQSGITAFNAYSKIKTIMQNVHCSHNRYDIVNDSYLLTENDLVIAVSQSGKTPVVVEFCAKAQDIGAKVVSLTTNQDSDLYKVSDYPLIPVSHISDDGSKYFITQTMFNLIFDSIYIYLQIKLGIKQNNFSIPLFDYHWFE